MSGGIIREVGTVSIPRDQLITLLNATEKIRTGFLMCAPRFAAGSRGEKIVALADTIGKTIDEIVKNVRQQLDKASDPATEAEPAPSK